MNSPGNPLDLETIWDAVVIGAGPAGAASALLLAQRGWRVLLVERAAWPREKVCGGCLNARAVASLNEIGIAKEIFAHAAGIPKTIIRRHRSQVQIDHPGSIAIARSELDDILVRAAESHGVRFISSAKAIVCSMTDGEDLRDVRICRDDQTRIVRAKVVLACDGIGGSSLANESWATWSVAADSWFGVSIEVKRSAMADLEERAICMHVGRDGYVGAVRLNDWTIHLAAALDHRACKEAGGPVPVVENILRACGRETSLDARMCGTPMLTRSRATLAGHRVLAVGDACGYVEPFTGEGIAWALQSAQDAAALLSSAPSRWNDAIASQWNVEQRASIRRRQRICRLLRFGLHRPLIANAAFALMSHMPPMARQIAHQVSGDPEMLIGLPI